MSWAQAKAAVALRSIVIVKIAVYTIAIAHFICSPVYADVTKSRFSDARFETATFVFLQASKDKRLQKTAFLWVYQTRLGSLLKKREPNAAEVSELRRLCREMHKAALALQGKGFDGYGIELANGKGDTSKLSPDRRVVFFFWDKGTCRSAPSRGKIN